MTQTRFIFNRQWTSGIYTSLSHKVMTQKSNVCLSYKITLRRLKTVSEDTWLFLCDSAKDALRVYNNTPTHFGERNLSKSATVCCMVLLFYVVVAAVVLLSSTLTASCHRHHDYDSRHRHHRLHNQHHRQHDDNKASIMSPHASDNIPGPSKALPGPSPCSPLANFILISASAADTSLNFNGVTSLQYFSAL